VPRKAIQLPSREYLVSAFRYEPLTGGLTWKTRPTSHFKETGYRSAEHTANLWNNRYALTTAGRLTNDGYLRVCLDGVKYLVHRIIYKMIHGVDPDNVDHDNGNKTENTPDNVISKTVSGNMQNKRKYINNLSGCSGVTWAENCNKWRATLNVNKVAVPLGYFCLLEDAVAARKNAEAKYGFTARHGT